MGLVVRMIFSLWCSDGLIADIRRPSENMARNGNRLRFSGFQTASVVLSAAKYSETKSERYKAASRRQYR
ncbi:hypothetical protein HMPREF9120_01003 [Neisseria sp. oral taxon 020 str. F0370]|nr:hypothetical protein HMPREF9120_01003 [Neisseria sp. oral taxon 020 str. F0370]